MDMKFNVKIPRHLKEAYNSELNCYRHYLNKKEYDNAWNHLERSHIIGQSYPIEHTYSHWLMLKFGFRQKDTKEVFGQIIRLVVGGWTEDIKELLR